MAHAEEYVDRIAFDDARMSVERIRGFDVISLEDTDYSHIAGAPMLPMKQIDIALPTGAVVTGVSVKGTTVQTLEGTFEIMPSSKPETISGTPPDSPFRPDASIYSRDANYPGHYAEVAGQWDLWGQEFVTLNLYPMQYNPVSKKAELVTGMHFEVTYSIDKSVQRKTCNFNEKNKRLLLERLQQKAFNPEDVAPIPSFVPNSKSKLAADDYEYVIITTNYFMTRFDTLAEWRTQMGMPATMVDINWIYINYTGANSREKIRNFVIDAQSSWGSMYFLMGGDVGVVPTHIYNHSSGEQIPNDTYFADYDDDWKYEVYIGRSCVDTLSDIDNYVGKVLTYEKNPPTIYGNKVFFMGFDLDSSTPSEECKKDIKDDYVPAGTSFFREYDSESGNHVNDCRNYLNQGMNLVNHIDHCGTSYMGIGNVNHGGGFDNSDAAGFTNGTRYSNYYTLGCWPGNYQDNCWGEVFVGDDQGGITFTGNSRSGWYNPGNVSTLSHLYEKRWWRSLYNNNYYNVGATLADSLNSFYPIDDYYKYIYKELNVLGDPALHLWTLNPMALTVTHDSEINPGSQYLSVHVKCINQDVQNALVCVQMGTDVYAYGLTSITGNALLSIAPTTTGTMTVTVTAQNKLYYEGSITVSSAPSAPTIGNVSPNCGPEAGGTLLTLTGTNFTNSPPMSVQIDGNACTGVAVFSATMLGCFAPAGTDGWKTIEVSNTYGSDSASGFEGFRYFPCANYPYNFAAVNTEWLGTPADVDIIVSGNPGTPFILFYSLGGGPLPTSYGTAGLDMPAYQLFMSSISGDGYTTTTLPVPNGYGPATFYLQSLGLDGAGKPKWAVGGGNPYGSIKFNLLN